MFESEIADFIEKRDQLKKRVDELEERIRKARKILTATIPQSQMAREITRAVDALDGE